MAVGWAIASTMLAGILVCGGLGYLADRFVGAKAVFLPIGMVIGVAVGMYAIWLEYVRGDGHD